MGTLYLDAKIKHQDYTRSDIAIEPATTVDGFEILSGILAGDDRDLADKCADYLLFINRDNSTTSTELAIIYFQADSELT